MSLVALRETKDNRLENEDYRPMPKSRLAELRKLAGFQTQESLAQRLNVSQSTIAKWEIDIGSISIVDLDNVAQVLGCDRYELLPPIPTPQMRPLTSEEPLRSFRAELAALRNYISNGKAENDSDAEGHINILNKTINQGVRRPLVGLLGSFDSGKSTLVNSLLGEDLLPTGYQAMTSLPTYVLHNDLKPKWMKEKEDVAVMASTELSDLYLENALDSRVACGSRAMLSEYASHRGNGHPEAASFAVVFSDSATLKSCSFLDLPGFKSTEQDESMALDCLGGFDVLLYTSTVTAFMNVHDKHLAGLALEHMPVFEQLESFPTLGNVILVATRCGRDDEDHVIDQMKEDAADDLWKHWSEGTLSTRARRIQRSINKDDLKARIIPFSIDVPRRATQLMDALKKLLINDLPPAWKLLYGQQLTNYKENTCLFVKKKIESWETLVREIRKCKEDYQKARDAAPSQSQHIEASKKKVLESVKSFQRSSKAELCHFFDTLLAEKKMVQRIKRVYGDKRKYAQKNIAGHLTDVVQGKISSICSKYGEKLKQEITAEMESLPKLISLGKINMEFKAEDLTGAFIGGLSGLTTLAGLSIWASAVAAGSNLGGYILTAKVVSILSGLGISVAGGTGGAAAAVAALGGPQVVIVGFALIVAAVAWGAYKLFGPSWQETLARKVIKELKKKGHLERWCDSLDTFWEDTRKGVKAGYAGISQNIQERLAQLKELAENPQENVEEMKRDIEKYRRLLDFFSGMPLPEFSMPIAALAGGVTQDETRDSH